MIALIQILPRPVSEFPLLCSGGGSGHFQNMELF